ncbi:MAG: hypothetical protein WCO96_01250 [Actinomycetes bacterium]
MSTKVIEILDAVTEAGTIKGAADLLGINEKTLNGRITRLGIRDEVHGLRNPGKASVPHNDPRGSVDWPSDREVEQIVTDSDNLEQAAERFGCTRPTLIHRMRRQGITARPMGRRRKPIDDPQRLQVDQLKGENKALKRENSEYAKLLASQESFFNRIVDATKRPVEPLKIKPRPRQSGKPVRSAILPIYDMQFGQLVRESDTPGGKGTFNVDVFDERLNRYLEGTKGALRHYASSYQLNELILVYGGDQVEGDEIFGGQAWQLELDPPRQVWELAGRVETLTRDLVEFARGELGIEYVLVVCVPGNHGKVGGKRGGARPATYSWDWLLFKLLEHRASEWVDDYIIEPAGSAFFYAAGQEFQAVHGDQIRGWGGIPFYGLQRFDARSVRLHNRLYRYLLMGHHHQAGEIPQNTGAETIISGDWVGANNLSGLITAASRPQQKILYVSEKWGITSTERIYLTDDEAAYQPSAIHGRRA